MTSTDKKFSQFGQELNHLTGTTTSSPLTGKFSEFIVYVDESGDHGMERLDQNYPIFVLCFCIFHKHYYCETVVPALGKFKFNHFGHDLVILHEHDIRKEKGAFHFFQERAHRLHFMNELTEIIDSSNFVLIGCVIDKTELKNKPGAADNPYHIALGFCLEKPHDFLQEKSQDGATTHVIVECRGKKEDNELELEFRRICDGENRAGISLPFHIVFADKKVNSAGLQLADLVARPIGLSVLKPTQKNRAFEILKKKFYCGGGRQNGDEGFERSELKLYHPPKSEKPR